MGARAVSTDSSPDTLFMAVTGPWRGCYTVSPRAGTAWPASLVGVDAYVIGRVSSTSRCSACPARGTRAPPALPGSARPRAGAAHREWSRALQVGLARESTPPKREFGRGSLRPAGATNPYAACRAPAQAADAR